MSPRHGNYCVEIWGKNLPDELYVNGGFDTRDTWGYDFSIVGRSREVGVSISFDVLSCYEPAATLASTSRRPRRAASFFARAASGGERRRRRSC